MRKIITLILCLATSVCTLAWGPTGHRATGLVAEKHLTKKAKKALERILQGQSLAMASTWMDDVRSDSTFDYMADWHWVTIQKGESYDQSTKNPNGDVVQTLERVIQELKSGKLNPSEEAQRIKILIHLVGDLHMPLHVGGGTDRGGNDVRVTWFRTDSNLHRVWDSDMIDDTRLSYTELAESVNNVDDAAIKRMQSTNVRDWANESMNYRQQVYAYGDGRLGYAYSYRNFPLIRTRIQEAGIRLAGLLNDIYK
ncbi:S1/P1 nuclease [Chryseolinea sp. T2]|uniref:S1/P1 nuclease n=1 Tax=Chryseolinea sp. T2 TaxID=3129255 RepID=UPI003077163D